MRQSTDVCGNDIGRRPNKRACKSFQKVSAIDLYCMAQRALGDLFFIVMAFFSMYNDRLVVYDAANSDAAAMDENAVAEWNSQTLWFVCFANKRKSANFQH